jgi:glyoxylase-like metal-dependent hydrolase (beta-lactamase superfamily II)
MLGAAALPQNLAGAVTPPFKRQLGALEIMVVSDGALAVSLAFQLPETPAAEAAALLAAHGLPPGGMPSQTNVTLVKSGRELILIDAGSGHNFQSTAGKLADNLEGAGIAPEHITKVVFTHGHPDHLWGAIDEFDEPRFPNASYVISAPEWDFWSNPQTPSRMPEAFQGMAAGSARILKRLDGKIERRRGGEAVAPGLSYVETFGHTPGHMSVLAESNGQHLLIGGDVLTNPAVSFARPDWRMGNDVDRDQGAATRRRLLDRLASERLPLIGFHLPYPGHGMVERKDNAYRFVPV